jgi:SAM-dependent methyltransferase
MYFDKLKLWERFRHSTVLHVAPEEHLTNAIQAQNPTLYIKGDLDPNALGIDKVDVTAMPYSADSIDFLICNHVLEHVHEDRRALSEIFRVLKPGGSAILQTPYSPCLEESFSDSSITTNELRLRYYGQKDHVRIYGRDLFARIEGSGLCLHRYSHGQCLSEFNASHYGVNPKEDLILAVKPQSGR